MSKVEEIIFKSGGNAEEEVDLDMAPFLGLMATLIPMLLLATVFVRLSVLGAKVPVLAEAQTAIDKAKEDNRKKQLKLNVILTKDKTVVMQVRRGGALLQRTRVPASAEGTFDADKLKNEFAKIKRKNPELFQARMNPTEVVKYEDIVAVMDTMRLGPNGEQFPVKDKDTGKVFQTNLMFDDITFGNIMGDE